MKILNVKTAIAAVCVVAAGFSGMKAYNVANQSEADMLLAENIEALSAGDNGESTCSATADCISGGVKTGCVNCTGHNGNCYSGYGYVTCDGSTSKCTYNVAPEYRDSTKCNENGLPLKDE